MSAPPKRLKLSAVPEYLEQKYGITKSRQAMYFWKDKGVNGVKLECTKYAGTYYTTERRVDDFMEATGK